MWGLSLFTAIMLIVLGIAIGMYITSQISEHIDSKSRYKEFMKNLFISHFIFCLFFFFLLNKAVASDCEFQMADMNWPSATLIANVDKFILEVCFLIQKRFIYFCVLSEECSSFT